MYTIGASFPVLSKYLIGKNAPSSAYATANWNFSSWARRLPNLFSTVASNHPRHSIALAHVESSPYGHSNSSIGAHFDLHKKASHQTRDSARDSIYPQQAVETNFGAPEERSWLEGPKTTDKGYI